MEFVLILEIFIGLLFVAALVAISVQRLRMPYTVGLVLVGLALAVTIFEFFTGFTELQNLRGLVVPQLILVVLVPPLIFEAAFHIKFSELRKNLWMIMTFAIPGVILSMFIVGRVISWGTALSLNVALLFGALIAATDPVAVVALFRSLGVPKRIQILVEGESLLNDGAAIVLFNLTIAVILGEQVITPSSIIVEFLVNAGGGLLIGIVVGGLLATAIRQVNNHLVEISFTIVAAYSSFLVAENFHVSGVLAVVAAGLYIGNIGPRGMSPTTRISLFSFWEYVAFLANSFVFLVVGLVIDLESMIQNWPTMLLAIGVVLIARAVVIYIFSGWNRSIPVRMQHVLYWGGLRGGISLALALSIPQAIGSGELILIQDMTFAVVLFTLLVQGTTMKTFITRLGLVEKSAHQEVYRQSQARVFASSAAYQRVKTLYQEGMISNRAWQILKPAMKKQIEARAEIVDEITQRDRRVEALAINNAYLEGLREQKGAYSELSASGVITEDDLKKLISEVDYSLVNQEIGFGDLLIHRASDQPPITKLIMAVIDENDRHDVLNILNIMGIPVTTLSSSSGSGERNKISLLIGVEDTQIDPVVRVLNSCCEKNFEFRNTIFDRLPVIGKKHVESERMIVYVFDIDHYEEF
ncbi:MAG: Na+/H+ antiporter [Anaerolineales bacterium]|jgi:CPA1 family monovalent cation:H+ antiporter